jgi:L-iditol 2-dehydrogenase
LLLVSEPNAGKRKLSLKFGADQTIDPGDRDAVEAVHDYTGGKGVDYLIEASGAGRVLAFIPGLIRKQATVLLYGHGHAGVDLSVLNNLMFREPTLVTPVGASGGFESGWPAFRVPACPESHRATTDRCRPLYHTPLHLS